MYAKVTLHALGARERWVRGGSAAVITALAAAIAGFVGSAALLLVVIGAVASAVLAATALAGRDYRLELGSGGRTAAALAVGAVVLYGDIISVIEGFLEDLWSAVASFFGTIFGAISSGIAEVFTVPLQGLGLAWSTFQAWADSYGPLAPLLTVLMIGLFMAIAVFFIWLLVKFSVSESEQTAEEAEEGV